MRVKARNLPVPKSHEEPSKAYVYAAHRVLSEFGPDGPAHDVWMDDGGRDDRYRCDGEFPILLHFVRSADVPSSEHTEVFVARFPTYEEQLRNFAMWWEIALDEGSAFKFDLDLVAIHGASNTYGSDAARAHFFAHNKDRAFEIYLAEQKRRLKRAHAKD
jgi:hypothetical protein